MRRVQGPRRSKSGTEDEDQEEEAELIFTSGQQQQQQPVHNLHHYVGHSLIKQTTTPPPTFRSLSRSQPHATSFQHKNHKPGLRAAHSHGSNSKTSELTCLQRRAAELTGVPLINFNIKRSAAVRTDIPLDTNEGTGKPDYQMKLEDFNPHQHPPLYQPQQIHNMVMQQHLRFLSAYQHSGLLAVKGQPVKDHSPPPSSPTILNMPTDPTDQQNRTLRKNYSMCEDILANNEMKNLWNKSSANGDFNYNIEDHIDNNRVNFKLGATLSLPQMMLVGQISEQKDVDGNRNNEFQMGKEDEARFLPIDLLSDVETTTSTEQQLTSPTSTVKQQTVVDLPTVKMASEQDNDYGFSDSKSLPTFLGDFGPIVNKKQILRKTVSLQGDQQNYFYTQRPAADFSLFPQTSQSDLLCSLRSSLVKNSAENYDLNRSNNEAAVVSSFQQLSNRKITTSRHLERAIKSLSINTDISRKF